MYLAARPAQDKAGAHRMLFLYSLIMAVEDSVWEVWGMATLDMYRNCRDGPSQGGKAAALTQSEVLQPCKRQTCLGLQILHVSPTSGSAAARERPRTGKADGTILLEDDVCGF